MRPPVVVAAFAAIAACHAPAAPPAARSAPASAEVVDASAPDPCTASHASAERAATLERAGHSARALASLEAIDAACSTDATRALHDALLGRLDPGADPPATLLALADAARARADGPGAQLLYDRAARAFAPRHVDVHLDPFDGELGDELAWSPDASRIAVGDVDSVKVVAGDRVVLRVPHPKGACRVRLEGTALAVLADDGLSRWDLATGDLIDRVPVSARTAFSPDRRLFVGSTGEVEDATGQVVVEAREKSVEVSVDSNAAVTVSTRETSTRSTMQRKTWGHDDVPYQYMAVLDVRDVVQHVMVTRAAGKRVETHEALALPCRQTRPHERPARRNRWEVALSPLEPQDPDAGFEPEVCDSLDSAYVSADGSRVALLHVAFGRPDQSSAGRAIVTLAGTRGGGRTDVAGPDGATSVAVALADDGRALLWQLRGDQVETRLYELTAAPPRLRWSTTSLPAASRATTARFSPDGARVALADGRGVVVVDAATGSVARRLPGRTAARIESLAGRPGGLLVGLDDGSVRVLAPDRVPRAAPVYDRDLVAGLAWSPSGDTFAAYAGHTGTEPTDKSVRLLDAQGAPRLRLEVSASSTRDLAFSPDGTRLFAATTAPLLPWWSTADGAPQPELTTGTSAPHMSVASAGVRLATLDEGDSVTVLSLQPPRVEGAIKPSAGPVERLRFSPDGRTLHVLTRSTLAAYDAVTRALLWSAPLGQGVDDASDLVEGGDALLATGWGMRAQLRSAADGALLHTFTGAPNPRAAFVGSRVVVADDTVLRVHARDGAPLGTIVFGREGGAILVETPAGFEAFVDGELDCAAGALRLPREVCDARATEGLLGQLLGP